MEREHLEQRQARALRTDSLGAQSLRQVWFVTMECSRTWKQSSHWGLITQVLTAFKNREEKVGLLLNYIFRISGTNFNTKLYWEILNKRVRCGTIRFYFTLGIYFVICMFCLHACMSTMCTSGILEVRRQHLAMEFMTVVSCHVKLGIKPMHSARADSAFSH